MNSGVGATDCRDGRASGHDELVVLALVVGRLRLGQDHVVEVEPQLADVAAALVHRELARPDAAVGGGVAAVLEVGAVVARALPAGFRDCKRRRERARYRRVWALWAQRAAYSTCQ